MTRDVHDGDLGPSLPQLAQSVPISLSNVVDAGGEDAQAHTPVLVQERRQFGGTVKAGAPGDEQGDIVVLLPVQAPGRDQIQEAQLCMVASP